MSLNGTKHYHLNVENTALFFQHALTQAHTVRVDTLDCHISCARQSSNADPKEVMDRLLQLPKIKVHATMILRDCIDSPYWEACLSSLEHPCFWFVWMDLHKDIGDKLIEQHNITNCY